VVAGIQKLDVGELYGLPSESKSQQGGVHCDASSGRDERCRSSVEAAALRRYALLVCNHPLAAAGRVKIARPGWSPLCAEYASLPSYSYLPRVRVVVRSPLYRQVTTQISSIVQASLTGGVTATLDARRSVIARLKELHRSVQQSMFTAPRLLGSLSAQATTAAASASLLRVVAERTCSVGSLQYAGSSCGATLFIPPPPLPLPLPLLAKQAAGSLSCPGEEKEPQSRCFPSRSEDIHAAAVSQADTEAETETEAKAESEKRAWIAQLMHLLRVQCTLSAGPEEVAELAAGGGEQCALALGVQRLQGLLCQGHALTPTPAVPPARTAELCGASSSPSSSSSSLSSSFSSSMVQLQPANSPRARRQHFLLAARRVALCLLREYQLVAAAAVAADAGGRAEVPAAASAMLVRLVFRSEVYELRLSLAQQLLELQVETDLAVGNLFRSNL
jgi:hypothetical protein